MYDLVIRDGMVLDGSGSAPIRADVGVRGSRIVGLGRITEKAAREIDAEGHFVTPGFVDAHTHMDAQIFWDPLGTSSCWHGVTTAVMGHCGFTLAPSRNGARDLATRSLERSEDISPEALSAGIDWSWETFPEYLNALDHLPKGINYAANLGHSTLRTWAMGERAFEEDATDDDLFVMEEVLREALRLGAIGFTTSRNDLHQTTDDQPVASRLATWSEVVRLVTVMGDLGAGIFQLASERTAASDDPGARADYWRRLTALAAATRVPVAFGVPATTNGLLALDAIDAMAAAGGRPIGLSHSRGVSMMLSFETGLPFDRLAEWREFRSLPLEQQAKELRDPLRREQLVNAARFGDYGTRIVGAEARPPDYDLMFPLERPTPPYRSVASLSAERGVDPVDFIVDAALEHDLRLFFVQPAGKYPPDSLLAVMRHPRTVMTFSDSGAHATQVADSSIQTHLLSYWVRDLQKIPLPEAVRMITYGPATAWGFYDRGLVRPGFVADLNVFDLDTISPEMPVLTADLPGGAKRITQRSRGIRATIVGGEVLLSEGEHTGALPGHLLRGPLADRDGANVG